jgi:hypothetical protein
MSQIVRSRALLLVAKELGLEQLDAEVLEAFAVSATGPRDLILLSIAVSLKYEADCRRQGAQQGAQIEQHAPDQ